MIVGPLQFILSFLLAQSLNRIQDKGKQKPFCIFQRSIPNGGDAA
uniref:Uncharacterized protein n=1 Tax=Rhizophora mucronata TaxID=61149 RepID=A0A2P2KQ30_RHIMU